MTSHEEVSFQTLDGLTLRGTLYLAGRPNSPAIIITPGFNVTRDVLLPRIAQRFQRDGISALIYDPRTIGSSDGNPRNDINPAQQATDYHDALTFLKTDGRVDPERIAYWGFSFGGAVALAAAALDKRAKAVISVCPLTHWDLDESKWRGVMAKAMQDRESQLSGNGAFSLPMITDRGVNPAGFSSGMGASELGLVAEARKIPGFNLNTTIQTYYHIMAWSPFKLLRYLAPTPVLMVTPEDDQISPLADQKELIYNRIQSQKQMYVVPKKGHMDVLDGESFETVMAVQVTFIRQCLGSEDAQSAER
ncbi:Alpha/Beta hydrolase protein [Xylaria bambusicola]|uniref:Alpha/Beta hydrolase protein n=1 Tax=Xylaria bambusicola TaxID=326684 RepID=UPI002007C046|nr:Alpha/Beta hydrolase protein [Xylaria bambusicola]KAI0502949.1 Alpha/Beta hydrolase protein [Xylaria bambusicola]